MEQAARLPCQQLPNYGYHQHHQQITSDSAAAAAWMVNRRETVTAADIPSPVKFHHQHQTTSTPPHHHQHPSRSSPYPSAAMGPRAISSAAPRSAMARRNERERKRVRLVNHGFATLRQYLPQSSSRKKLSKMETLRSAIEYIKQLQFLLDPTSSSTSPQYGEVSSDPPSWSASGPPSWDDSWTQQSQQPRSPSPHTSLSPEADLIDFAAFS